MNNSPRILVVKLTALGDVVMASTMLPALRERWPNAHITWLCGRGVAPLVECFEGIDSIVTLDDAKLLAGSLPERLYALGKSMRLIAGQSYDLCLVAHKDWRYRLLTLGARCRTVRCFGGRNGPIPGRWHGDEYRRLATGEDGPFLTSAPLAQLKPGILTTQDEHSIGNSPVLLAPGGARNVMRSDDQRRWPLSHYRELAELLLSNGIPVALAGSKSDLWVESAFSDLDVTSWIGRTDILGFLRLLRQSSIFVTHDTGPLHFAYLVGTPTVAMFGPTLGIEKTPKTTSIRILTQTMPCSPCYDGNDYSSCHDVLCMKTLHPSDAFQAIQELLTHR